MSPHNIQAIIVSKLFRAYGLYNQYGNYIYYTAGNIVSKLFRAYGLYNYLIFVVMGIFQEVSKLFRAYGLYNDDISFDLELTPEGFKALSSLRVI